MERMSCEEYPSLFKFDCDGTAAGKSGVSQSSPIVTWNFFPLNGILVGRLPFFVF